MSDPLSQPAAAGPRRIAGLDTLRFLAALMVVVAHARGVYRLFEAPWPVEGVMNAYSAVALFFVLSGYVLHQSCVAAGFGPRAYGSFVVRRVLRLYPLHLVALGLAAVVILALPLGGSPLLGSSEYAQETIARGDHHDLRQWLNQAILVGGGMDSTFANPPIWTLAAEMRISLLFPLLSLLVARTGIRTAAVLTLVSMACGPWLAKVTLPTAGMVPLFLLGALAAKAGDCIPGLRRTPGWLFWAGLVVYAMAACTSRTPFGRLGLFYVAGLGSALMMLVVAHHEGFARRLSHPVLVGLGLCSYGIYLLHFPLLLLVTWAAGRAGAPPAAILPALLVLVIPLAWILYHAVERPFIVLGRRLSGRKISRRPVAP